MTEHSREFDGLTVDGLYPLGERLGGTHAGGVFVTTSSVSPGERAAIKLIPELGSGAGSQLELWERAARLSHPSLARIERWGRCNVAGADSLYIVTEWAGEVLSDVLRERPLSVDETRHMIAPALEALAYLHGQGFAHGSVRPSNFFAIGERLKVSSDRLVPLTPESALEDARAVAATIAESLTQRRPTSAEEVPPLPEPFDSIVRHGLAADPAQRWTVAEIASRLRGKPAGSAAGMAAVLRRYAKPGGIAAATFLLLAIWTWPGLGPSQPPEPTQGAPRDVVPVAAKGADDRPSPMPQPPPTEPAVPAPAAPPPPASTAADPPESTPPPEPPPDAGAVALPDEVIRHVLPDIPASALRTIRGRPRASVRVEIDREGNVSATQLDSPGPSRYFADFALDAARQWKFTPASSDRRRVIWFLFTRSGPEVISVQ